MAKQDLDTVPGTGRLEAFSDGVFAIIVTLLVLNLKLPKLDNGSTKAVLRALLPLVPPFISFAFSFFTVAIFWVNHHHFVAPIMRTDWRLMWYNNLLLFWLAVVPFTTSFIGEHPTVPLVVAIYALNMCLVAGSFCLLEYHVFARAHLLPKSVEQAEEQRELRRSLLGVGSYAAATVLALLYVYAALVLLILIPIYFIVPNLLVRNAPLTNE